LGKISKKQNKMFIVKTLFHLYTFPEKSKEDEKDEKKSFVG